MNKRYTVRPSKNPLLVHAASVKMPLLAKCKLAFAGTLLRWQNVVLTIARLLLYKKDRNKVQNILVFRTGSLGDSLCAIPAIQSIKKQYSNAFIDILTNTGKANLAGLQHLLEKGIYRDIIDYNGYSKKKLIALLRQKQYDLIIQLPQVDASFFSLLRDLVIFRAIAPSGFGWHKAQVKLFRKIQARFLEFPGEIERLLELLRPHGILPVRINSILYPSPDDLVKAKQLLNESGVPTFENLIAVVVGAKRPQNRWPIDYFFQVVSYFSSSYCIILIGGGEDNELVQQLATIKNVINTCGRLTPMQSAAVISLCRLTISNDTGPMHLSYAVGTPTIALFSSRDLPGKWYPPQGNNRIFRAKNIPCQACFSETCNNNICMQAIPPADVISSAEELLGSH